MKWTDRDSAYLTVITLLVIGLAFFLADMAPEGKRSASRSQSLQGSESGTTQPRYPFAQTDELPVMRAVPMQEVSVQQVRTIEITPEMSPEEIAEALNMRVEDLPPAYRQKKK